MSITLANLQDMTLNLLDESQDSTAGEYDTGAGTPAMTTAQTLTQYFNDGAALLARTCLPCAATSTAVSVSSGVSNAPLASFVSSSGAVIWQPLDVSIAGVSLPLTNEGYARIQYGSFLNVTPGTPAYWYMADNAQVALVPPPSSGVSVTIYGYAVPPPMVNGSDVATWAEPDEVNLYLTYYAAWRIGQKNTEDDTIRGKILVWEQAFRDAQERLAARLASQQPAAFQKYFARTLGQDAGAAQSVAAAQAGQGQQGQGQ